MSQNMSQTVKALVRLRELILNGKLAPGERLREVALVDCLKVSRTPVRAALARLAEEGLLEKMSGGGYMVREFTERDIQDAIDMRGMVEGMAARLAAERGVSILALNKIKDCVAQIDDLLLSRTNLATEDIARYLELNDLFHRRLIALSESFVVERMLERIVALPFASANAFVIAQSKIDQSRQIFLVAQEHHTGIVEAIENRQGMRVEYLVREHALLALKTLRTVSNHKSALNHVPGFKLISSAAT